MIAIITRAVTKADMVEEAAMEAVWATRAAMEAIGTTRIGTAFTIAIMIETEAIIAIMTAIAMMMTEGSLIVPEKEFAPGSATKMMIVAAIVTGIAVEVGAGVTMTGTVTGTKIYNSKMA